MTITFRVGRLPADQVSFGYSPAQECIHALHVLLNVRDHPLHVQWALQARRRISPALKGELERYRHLFAETPLPIFWPFWACPGMPVFAEELAAFRTGPHEPYGEFLTYRRLEVHDPLMAAYLADPAGNHQRFADFLAAFWCAVLADEWPELEERFAADIARRGRLLMRRGVTAAIDGLSPDVHVDHQSSTVVVRRREQAEVALGEEHRLCLAPSYFSWPHLYVSAALPTPVITYPVVEQQAEGQLPVPPDQLLKLLKAAGDATRLQILQLLAQRPRTTGELAGLLGMTEASVSNHLKQLQSAGFAVPERQSYYVFYRLVRSAMSDLARGLDEALNTETQK